VYGQRWQAEHLLPAQAAARLGPAGPAAVLKYLARDTYRVAPSNRRLVRVTDEAVTFSHKDYRQGGKH
jgi:hypothetical protein